MIDVKVFFHLEALEHARQDLANFERKLEDLVKLDFERAKNELTAGVAHFTAEIARLETIIPARVLGHIAEGVHPQMAVQLDANGIPTKAEQETEQVTH